MKHWKAPKPTAPLPGDGFFGLVGEPRARRRGGEETSFKAEGTSPEEEEEQMVWHFHIGQGSLECFVLRLLEPEANLTRWG